MFFIILCLVDKVEWVREEGRGGDIDMGAGTEKKRKIESFDFKSPASVH